MFIREYIHSFTPGFNTWYVLVAIFAVMMILVGLFSRRRGRGGKVRRLYGKDSRELTFKIIAGIFAAVIFVLVVVESSAGVIQWLDNHLDGGQDAFASIFLAPVVEMIVAIACYVIFWKLGVITANLKEYCIKRR